MKFTKRVAYCGGFSALLFSLNTNAMQGQDQGQEMAKCDAIEDCEMVDYSQSVPPLFTEKDSFEDYNRTTEEDFRCKVTVNRWGTDTTVVKGIIKIHRQENWGSADNRHETYTVEKIIPSDEKCSMEQEVSQLVDQLNSEQFTRASDKQIYQMVSAEGQAYQTDIVTFQDDMIEFTMRKVGNSTGPNEVRNYCGRDALKQIRNYVTDANAIQTLQHADGKFNKVDLGRHSSHSKKRNK
ncbi:MAG: hypothetical protein KC505_08060 [Myxococcales bacterium]|nr:hypothetical protein [Myxococcales bacterium]USN50387.1 MAG: hypothetical protein H6731_09005 [Myxococcales bacterium]